MGAKKPPEGSPPRLTLAADNPHIRAGARRAEADERRARARLSYSVKELTANLIRVVRGTGKPHHIEDQVAALIERLREYRLSAPDAAPGFVIADILRLNEVPEEHTERIAEQQIVRGALQIAASELLGQGTPRSAGETEMVKGIKARQKALDDEKGEIAEWMRSNRER